MGVPENHDYEQSPAELAAHFGAEGPVVVATRWLELLLDERNFDALWQLTDPAYRRYLAQAWVSANRRHVRLAGRDHAALVQDLIADEPESDLWAGFAETQLEEFAESWPNVDLDQWGWASRPRPYAPGYEIVLFTPTDGVARRIERPTLVTGLQLVMHHTPGGWLVAGPIDGLPPELAPAG